MKLCASWISSKMTRSRSSRSILFTLVVLIILVVESSTQTLSTTDSVVKSSNNDTTTQFNLDLQNPSTDTGIENLKEPQPEQPIELNDLDTKNIFSPGIPFNNTTFEENLVPSTTLDTITEVTSATESIPETKTTTYIPDSNIVTTLIPINVDTPPAASSIVIQEEELKHVDDKTENQPEITTTEMPEIPIEPRKEDAGFQSDSESNFDISSNSSESEGSHSPQEENKSTEGESSSSEDLSSDQVSAPQTEFQNTLLPVVKSTKVEEIGDVTESTGEISNDIVTELSKQETHTIMKKPAVDVVDSSAEPTSQPVQEVTSNAPVTKNPLVNFILERTTEVPVSRPQNTTDSNSDINAVQLLPTETEMNDDKRVSSTNPDENSLSSDSPIDSDKQETPDQEHLNVETPFGNSEIEMKLNEISYTENEPNDQTNHLVDDGKTSTTTAPIKSNESTLLEGTQEDQPIDEENRIPNNEDSQSPRNELLPDVSAVSDKLLPEINQIKPSTEASSFDDVPVQTKKDEIVSTEFETSTEKPTVDESNNQIKTSTEPSPHDEDESNIKTSTESPLTLTSLPEVSGEASKTSTNNIDVSLPDPKLYDSAPTENYNRHNDFDQTMKDETSSVVPNKIIVPASMGRAFNEIIPESLGKPLPTRSVGDEPLSSSYSSADDKTTTVLVLCAAAGGIFIAFSLAIYLISFQRQNGTLDIEMQEQRCGKDNLDEEDCDDDDSQTRVSLLNQRPSADSDDHSSY